MKEGWTEKESLNTLLNHILFQRQKDTFSEVHVGLF